MGDIRCWYFKDKRMKIIFISFYAFSVNRAITEFFCYFRGFCNFSMWIYISFYVRYCIIRSAQESWYNRPGGNPAWKNKSKSKNIFSFKASISKKVSLTIKRGQYRDFFLLSFPSTFFCILFGRFYK